MKRYVEIEETANAVFIGGEVHVFHYSRKELGCNDCSLRGWCNANHHVLYDFCRRLIFWRSTTYKYGAFRKMKTRAAVAALYGKEIQKNDQH